MKKIILFAITIATFVACEKQATNQFTISGTTKGIDNGTSVFLQISGDNNLISKDTATINNNKFEFTGKATTTELAFITIDGSQPTPFILENGTITATFDKDSIQNNKISGTTENTLFQDFRKQNEAVYKKMTDFQKENQEKYMTAQTANDTATINTLTNELEAIQAELKNIPISFIKKQPSSFLAILLTENSLLQKTITVEDAIEFLDKFDKKHAISKNYKSIETIIKNANAVTVGKKAPEFSAPSPEGTTIHLQESLGKVTIIDFWASWCGPCRVENPNLVALYNKWKDKGLAIIGVSLDKTADKWKEAIVKDGLTWTQVSNLKFWNDPIAVQYNVKSIPATFILDENGVIIATDLRGKELEEKIATLLQ